MKVEKLKKAELVSYCNEKGIVTSSLTKAELVSAVYVYRKKQVEISRDNNTDLVLLKLKIQHLADEYSSNLSVKISDRKEEMQGDDNSHYLIYRVLGIPEKEGKLIDEYQNTGRFLYKYAGSFLEEAASICLFFSNTSGGKMLVENTDGKRPKTFEIDFLNGNDAIELKWRDATTDGDHITKEHTRVAVIKGHGFTPVRVMFYYPQREQAIRIQNTLKTIYKGVDGEYHAGDDAWSYIVNSTGYDLKSILTDIADKRDNEQKKQNI
ncbi:ApaLI family restriction endonuclease [Desulfonauticus submarinus]